MFEMVYRTLNKGMDILFENALVRRISIAVCFLVAYLLPLWIQTLAAAFISLPISFFGLALIMLDFHAWETDLMDDNKDS